ncbi:ATP-binding cassette domain-containing protein [Nocardiopsis oceani]
MRRATGARVHAEGVTLTTGEGPVYTGIDFTARPGTLTVFQADSGGGRSALLLTLTGRMKPTEGTLHVDGYTLPKEARKVRRISSLGLMSGVNVLDDRLRVREHLSEARLLRVRPAAKVVADQAMEALGLADLDRNALIKELSALERRRLGIALGLVSEPRLLAVDNVEAGLSTEHQADMWRSLKDLASEGLTVIATCADAHELGAASGPDTQGPIPIRQGAPSGPDAGEAEGTEPTEEAEELIGIGELLDHGRDGEHGGGQRGQS